jgi:hypothetical protein
VENKLPDHRALIGSLRPSPDILLDVLRPNIDDSMLEEIAKADYGADVEEHLAGLRRIRDERLILNPSSWEPTEVLRLIRWSQPEIPDWKPGATGTQGHWMRAFSCAVLLRSFAEPDNWEYFDGENQTAVQLVESAIKLGREVAEAALRFFAWMLDREPRVHELDGEDRPFFALALFILAVHLAKTTEDSSRISELAALVEEETELFQNRQREVGIHRQQDQWLLGITLFDQCHDTWRAVAQRILLNPELAPEISIHAQRIGKKLLGSI